MNPSTLLTCSQYRRFGQENQEREILKNIKGIKDKEKISDVGKRKTG